MLKATQTEVTEVKYIYILSFQKETFVFEILFKLPTCKHAP